MNQSIPPSVSCGSRYHDAREAQDEVLNVMKNMLAKQKEKLEHVSSKLHQSDEPDGREQATKETKTNAEVQLPENHRTIGAWYHKSFVRGSSSKVIKIDQIKTEVNRKRSDEDADELKRVGTGVSILTKRMRVYMEHEVPMIDATIAPIPVTKSTSTINDECNMLRESISSRSSDAEEDATNQSAQDFLDFSEKVDDALDNDSSHGNDTAWRPSLIFGKPFHDVTAKSSYPLLADHKLNIVRARMA